MERLDGSVFMEHPVYLKPVWLFGATWGQAIPLSSIECMMFDNEETARTHGANAD